MATATDDNAADEKSDKSIWQLLNIRCTSNVFWQIKIENAVKSVKARDFDAYVAVGRFHKR